MSQDPKSFVVRDRRREVLGSYTEAEILKRIRSGRFKGDEEIAVAEGEPWSKISTHPLFYDAFVQRLLGGAPADERPADRASSVASQGSRSRKGATQRKKAAAATEVGQPMEERGTQQADKEVGATVHQSVIDELFNDGSQAPVQEPQYDGVQGGAGGTDLIRLEDDFALPDMGPEIAEPTQQLDAAPPPELEIPVPMEAPAPPKKSRRPLLYGAVGLLLLALLFKGGGDTPKSGGEGVEKPPSVGQFIEGSLSREERVAALLEEGAQLRAADTPLHIQGAVRVLQEAHGLEANNPKVLARLADASARLLGTPLEKEGAEQAIRGALNQGRITDPHYSEFYKVEGLVHLARGRLDEARDSLSNALDADPGNASVYLALGELFHTRGELAEARRFLLEAVRLAKEELRGFYLVALVAADLGEVGAAREAALEVVKQNPFHAASYLLLGKISMKQGQADEGRRLFETAVRLGRFAPPSVGVESNIELANLLESSGDPSASTHLRLAYYHSPSPDSNLKGRVSSLDVSRKSLQTLADEELYDANYFKDQGDEFLAQGKNAEGAKFLLAASLLDPKNSRLMVRYGEALERQASTFDDLKRVMNVYQRALDQDGANVKGLLRLGLLETEQFNLERGLTLLRAAERVEPESVDVAIALGKHFYKRKDYNESLNHFVRAGKMAPANGETLYYAGLLRLMFKKDSAKDSGPEAVRFFYEAYTLDPANYDALVEWLRLKVAGYEKNFAVKFVRSLMEKDPRNANLYWAMGEIYAANKEHRRAIQYYHRGLDMDNRSSKIRMALGRSLEAVGDLPKATAEYRFASVLDSKNTEGYFRAADLLVQMKDYDTAEKVLKFLISNTPNYPGAHRQLSRVYEDTRRKEAAIEAMEREVKNNPDHVKFIIELAQLYMKYEQYQKAVDELKKISNLPSLAKAPEHVYDKIRAYLLLSRSYRALNKPESAEAAIQLAVEIDDGDPELQRELGYVYYALQRDTESVKAFEKYLKRKPAAQDSATIQGIINKIRIEQ